MLMVYCWYVILGWRFRAIDRTSVVGWSGKFSRSVSQCRFYYPCWTCVSSRQWSVVHLFYNLSSNEMLMRVLYFSVFTIKEVLKKKSSS